MSPLDVLLASRLFDGCRRDEIEPLARSAVVRSHPRGACLCHAGDEVRVLHVIACGILKICHRGASGAELVVSLKSSGEVVGEYHLFSDAAHWRYDAVAIEPTECVALDRSALLFHLERHPALMRRTVEGLVTRLVDEHESVTRAYTAGPLSNRLAHSLEMLVDRFGEHCPEGVRIPIHFSQSTLAAMAGASREKVNRALAKMAADGVINLHAGVVTVVRPGDLH
jgi:CRP-like cAMP-binding protein